MLAAYSDGRPVGDAVADAGLPPPAIAPSFWRALDPQEASPSRLEPLTGRARTSAVRLWLLTDADARPIVGDELTLGEPEPAPGGRLWPVTGSGTIILNGQSLIVVTGADSEAQAHRLHLLGRHLPGWRCDDGQIPFVGQPEAWGAEGDAPLRRLTTGVVLQAIPRRLGGQLAVWRREEVMVARSLFVALPQKARIEVAEVAAGMVRLRAAGFAVGWHLRLRAAEAAAATAVGVAGDAELTSQGAGALAPVVAGPWDRVPQIQPMDAEALLRDALGGARLLWVGAALDGPLKNFGSRFWRLIHREASAVYQALASAGVTSISYSDRYLLTPLNLVLLREVLIGTPGGSGAGIHVALAPAERSARTPYAVYDAYAEDAVRRDVLRRLLPSARVTLAGRKADLPTAAWASSCGTGDM